MIANRHAQASDVGTLLTTLDKPNVKVRPRSTMASRSLQKLFGKNVRRYRKEAGLTQTELAEAAGMSQRHISEIEKSGSNVTIDTIVVLSRPLNRTPAEMLTSPEPRRQSKT